MNIPLKPLLCSAVLFSMSISSLAQIDIARTPSGKPDFNGNYDISSLTPFQRPAELGTRLFLGEDCFLENIHFWGRLIFAEDGLFRLFSVCFAEQTFLRSILSLPLMLLFTL